VIPPSCGSPLITGQLAGAEAKKMIECRPRIPRRHEITCTPTVFSSSSLKDDGVRAILPFFCGSSGFPATPLALRQEFRATSHPPRSRGRRLGLDMYVMSGVSGLDCTAVHRRGAVISGDFREAADATSRWPSGPFHHGRLRFLQKPFLIDPGLMRTACNRARPGSCIAKRRSRTTSAVLIP